MPQYRTMGLPKITGHTDKDIKNLRDLFYQQDEQLRYLFEHLGTDIASEIWENDNQSVKIKIDEDGIIAEIRESLDGDIQTLSAKINIAAGKVNTTVSRVENIERNYVSDEVLSGILSEYVTDDDIDTVYLSLKTEIDENAEAIALRATKEYVAESLNGYVTEAELSAELKISSDGVLTTVSKSYATTAAVNTAQNTANAAGAAAAGAQNTANNAQSAADAVAANLSNNYYAKTTIDQKFDGITLKYTDSAGNETSFKLTNGAIDITLLKNQVDAAAKTATNFISMRSDGGIEVGNKSGDSWTGYRSQMLADSFNIVDEDGTVLASYGANKISLGLDSEDSEIVFNGGSGSLYASDVDGNRGMYFSSVNFGFSSKNFEVQSLDRIRLYSHGTVSTADGSPPFYESHLMVDVNSISGYGTAGLVEDISIWQFGIGESSVHFNDGYGNEFRTGSSGITLTAPNVSVSGKIRGTTEGVSWYLGRDYATLIATGGTGTSAYFPVIDTKCNTGDWSMGCLGDSLYFVFTTNANYNAENNTTAKLCIDSSGHIKQSGYNVPSLKYENNYWGLGLHNGENADWIRTPSSGLIPYKSGGSSSLGTIGWPFSSVYTGIIGSADTIYFRAYQDKGYGQILIGAQSTDRGLELKPVTNNTCSLGWGSGRWKYAFIRDIYATYAVHVDSDRRLKKDISYDMSKLSPVFDELRPAIYQFIADEEEKLRMGFIAQDVIEALEKCGYDPNAFAILSETEMENGVIYGLTYEETNALLVYEVQQLKSRVAELEKRCA